MYYPQWLFLLPLSVILLTFHWTVEYGKDWTTFLAQLFGGGLAVLVAGYWITCNLMYQEWLLQPDKPRKPAPEEPRVIRNNERFERQQYT